MRYFIIIIGFLISLSCKKEPEIPQPEPSDGTANLNFHSRSFQFKRLRLASPANPSFHRWALDIEGILDKKDNFSLLIDSVNLQIPGKTLLRSENILGSLFNGDLIYGSYKLLANDSYEDFLTLDSLSNTKGYYSLQLNVLDSNLTAINDTLWISGTMEVELP